jgi:serine/threonine protein kinase
VCGYLPFEDQNTANLYRKILNADYQAPNFISDSVRELIAKMLTTDPEQRYNVFRIREHAWYCQIPEAAVRWEGERGERVLEEDILEQLDRFGFPRDYAIKCLQMNKHNHVTTTYYLLCEKKRRLPCRSIQPQEETLAGDFSGYGGQTNGEVELLAEAPTPEVGFENDQVSMSKVTDLANLNTPVDAADRAGGGYAVPHSLTQEKVPDSPGSYGNYNQWAQALNLPSPPSGNREVPNDGIVSNSPMQSGGQYPRSATNGPRYSENVITPRDLPAPTGSGSALQGATQISPRKRSPIQQSTGMATPRGPVPPPTSNSTPSRSGVYGSRTEGPTMNTPPGVRTSTPGRRPPSTNEGQLSARSSVGARPNTSQGMNTPSRPSGSATARGPNEARRRQFTGISDTVPNSARTGRAVSSTAGSGHAAARDLALEQQVTGSRSVGAPLPAWAIRQPGGNTPSYGSNARASSVSPEMSPPVDANHPTSSSVTPGPMVNPPLSARDARDDVMRTCRGAFNVSCTSSKAPKQILQEIQRALTLQRVSYKQASNFLVKCQRQNLRFEMEISHLDHLESIYVVRFRRVAGELVSYKELCSKILAEMKI